MFRRIPAEGLTSAALREALEYRAVIDAVRNAIQASLKPNLPGVDAGPYVCMEAIFADRAVVEIAGKYFSYPYTIDEKYAVTLGDPQAVVEDWKPVAMTEAVANALVTEAAGKAAAGSGNKYEVVVIRGGVSGNGNFYSDAALREAVPLFDLARVFVKSDAEHIAGGGKDIRNLVGQLTAPHFVEGKAGAPGEIRATLELINPEDAIGVKLREAYARGMSHLFGLSIDATAKTGTALVEGKRVRVASKFTKVNSVDLIVEPGAGGGLVRMVEANAETDDNRAANSLESHDMSIKQRLLEAIKAKDPARAAKINLETVTDEELEAAYREAVMPSATSAAATGVSLDDVDKRITEATALANARSHARTAIAASKLPARTQERLQKHFDAQQRFTEAQVDAAIKEAREEIAPLLEGGRVAMPMFDGVTVEDRRAKVKDMLDAFFDPAHKNHRDVISFKECYIEITGDRRVTGRLAEADASRLTESLGATTFDQALGDSITRRLVAEYNAAPYPDIRQVASVVPVMDFRTQRRPRIGGYGDLPAVNEAAGYAALTSPSDEEATYAASKRGGTEDITLEMIRNDDVGAIRRIPVKLGRAARRTLVKFALDFFRTNPAIYDTVAFFHATHNNLFATALSAAELSTHRLAMLKQAELSSADRLGIAPATILVPMDLAETAFNLFNRNTNLDKTFQQSWNMNVIPVWYWTDTNDWCTVASPADIPTIEIGFLDGREDPELFVQDMPNVGSMFSNDKLTYKIRHIYGGAVTDFRGATKAVVP